MNSIHPHQLRTSALVIITLVAGIILPRHSIHAADSYWTNLSGGIFGNSGNWDPGVPAAADNAIFTNNASYTVTWAANAANANALFNAPGGTVSQDISGSSWLISGSYVVGQNLGANSTVDHTTGTLLVTNAAGTGSMIVGQAGNGTYTLSGGTVIADRLVATNASVLNLGYGSLTANRGVNIDTGGLALKAGTVSGQTLNFTVSGGNSLIKVGGGNNGFNIGAGFPGGVGNFTLTGSATILTNDGAVQVGQSINPGNSILVAGGARMVVFNGDINMGVNSGNNSVQVSGQNSSLESQLAFRIGQNGNSGNTLTIDSGGRFIATNFNVNVGSASPGNVMVVTGSNSLASIIGMTVGGGGNAAGNTLYVLNGAQADFGGNGFIIGNTASDTGNSLVVDGAGSVLTNNGLLYLGNAGGSGQIVVTNGGRLVVNSLMNIGNQAAATNNEVTVTGADSLLKVNGGGGGFFYVGNAGSNSALHVRNGGTVVFNMGAGDVFTIGNTASSINNTLTVSGATLIATNSAATGPLEVRRGNMTMNAGSVVTVDNLIVNNGAASVFTFNGGALNTKATTVNNGSTFVVGDGTSTASLNFVGGTHAFADGLTISSNATLKGTGSTTSAVTVNDGGHLAPGSSPGTLTVGPLTLGGGSVLDFELGPHDANGVGYVGGGTNDLIVVNGNLTLDGILNVTALPGFGPFPGAGPDATNEFRLFNYTGILTDNGLSFGSLPGGTTAWIDTSIAGQVNLFIIPESTSAVLVGMATVVISLRRRRSAAHRV